MGIDRRSFLRSSALLGVAGAAQALIPAVEAEAFLFGRRRELKTTETRLVMGTYVSITTFHRSEDKAREAIALGFAEIDRLNAILSRHNDSTPLSLLNARGSIGDAPDELVEIVRNSLFYHTDSGGAFDITVLPLLELYRQRFAAGQTPGETEIGERLPLVGSQHVSLDGTTIRFARAGMGITTDGIAKGYIVDRAATLLDDQGMENYLINAGGDIRTRGSAARGRPWTIAVQDPAKERRYPELIRLADGAVATSGNYEIFYDEAKLFHHIVDPHTGHSPQLTKSVTTLAPTVMAADALSTAVFVQGPRAGTDYIDTIEDTACLIIGRDDTAYRSRRWPKQEQP